jgi:lysyl-tRNA synthetase class 2
MVTTIANNVFGTLKIEHGEDKTIDLTRPWRQVTYQELIKEKAGDDYYDLSHDEQVARAKELGASVVPAMNALEIENEIYDKLIDKTLIQPTFGTRLQKEWVPLEKAFSDDDSLVDVFELVINGQELAPGYSELNDPVEQRKRFEAQAANHEEGDAEGFIDEDFLTAMEHGMPPAGGMGIGIDRLVMLLTGAESIRDVILFPHLRSKK